MAQTYDQLILSDHPLLYWPLANDANDISGNGYHGTVNGTWNFNQSPSGTPPGLGPGSTAGGNSFILSPNITWPAGTITIEEWTYYPGASIAEMTWAFSVANFDDYFGNPGVGFNNGSSGNYYSSVAPSVGLHHLVYVFQQGTQLSTFSRVYVDGVLQTMTGSTHIPPTLGTCYLKHSGWFTDANYRRPAGRFASKYAVYAGELTSDRVQLHYQAGLGQMADNFASANVLTAPLSLTISSSTTSTYTLEAGEPGSGTNSGWSAFTVPTSGRYRVSTVGSTCDTLLDVYTGSSLGALTSVASSDDEGGNGTSRLVMSATAGTTYYARVALKTGTAGSYLLTVQADDRWLEECQLDSAQLIWRFDNGSTNVNVSDRSGNSRDGVWSSQSSYNLDQTYQWGGVKGAYRGCYNGFVTSPNITWPTTGSITVEALIRFGNVGRPTMMYSWASAQIDFRWSHQNNPLYMGMGNTTSPVSGPPWASVAGDWHHLTVVIPMGGASTTAVKYYVDGVLLTSAFGGTAFTFPAFGTSPFRINYWSGTSGWDPSYMDEITAVSVYFTELSPARIMAHYRALFGTFSDRLADYEVIPAAPGWTAAMKTPSQDSTNWTTDVGEPLADPVTRTAWAAMDGDGGTYQFDTIGSTYDTTVAVYTGTPGSLTLVASDSSSGGGSNGKLTFATTTGTRYFLQVGASPGANPDYGTIYPRLTKLGEPGSSMPSLPQSAAELAHTAYLLKGRSTKAYDAQAGG